MSRARAVAKQWARLGEKNGKINGEIKPRIRHPEGCGGGDGKKGKTKTLGLSGTR